MSRGVNDPEIINSGDCEYKYALCPSSTEPTNSHPLKLSPHLLTTTMANINNKIETLQEIITKISPIAIACWTAVQQPQSLDEKNRAGYTLFKITVILPIVHPTASLISNRETGLPHLGIFSELRWQRETHSWKFPSTCCILAVSWRRRGTPY